MALPENRLSTEPAPGVFVGARALGVTATVDYEDGGKALSDPSAGLLFQRWRGRVLTASQIVLDAPTVAETLMLTGQDITELSFTFDQNMRPCIAFVEGGRAKLRWYDSAAQKQVTTLLAEDVKTPRVTLDDKRPTQSASSDIILAYIRGGALYHRRQRDRFQTEYLLDVGPHAGLIKIGMNTQNRLQFLLEVAQ